VSVREEEIEETWIVARLVVVNSSRFLVVERGNARVKVKCNIMLCNGNGEPPYFHHVSSIHN